LVEENANKIGRVTTTGQFTEFPIPTPSSDPFEITAGPDGALWFTEAGANQIGRITTTGIFTEFPIPTKGQSLLGITAGPDGALWFTEGWANKIGRITTAGVFSEFSVPSFSPSTGTSFPYHITAGPDGAIWFTELQTFKIGRVTTAGVFTEFPIPFPTFAPCSTGQASCGVSGITAAPDGALWFTVEIVGYTGIIGRIDITGAITEYPLPTNCCPHTIATGPDGALWFTDEAPPQVGVKIGRISTSGSIIEFPTPSSHNIIYITTGPDGALWFTEYFVTVNSIGRFIPSVLQVTPATGITASGVLGGQFSPTSFDYQISTTAGNANFSISGIPSWLNASFTSGIATTSPTTVTFSLVIASNLNPGTYNATISFTNTDTGLGNATRTATLTVTSIASLISNLLTLIDGYNLANGIDTSLDAKVQAAQAALDAMRSNSVGTACNQLSAFVNQTQAQSGVQLTVPQANQLISGGNQIRAALACS
jgi:virginiamycin B lyase